MGSIVEELLVKLTADNRDLKAKLKESENDVGYFGKKISALGPMIVAAFSAKAILDFGVSAFKAAEEQERANKRLMFAVKGSASAYKELTEQAEALRAATGIEPTSIMQIQQMGANAGYSAEKIKKVTQASIELAAVTGQDLQAAYMQVNTTFNGSVGRLTRLDAEFGTLTKAQLENGDAVDLIIKKYGGVAAKSATETQKLSSNWDEFKKHLGSEIAPAINSFFDLLNKDFEIANSKYLHTFGERNFNRDRALKLIEERKAVEENLKAWQIYDIKVSQQGFLQTDKGKQMVAEKIAALTLAAKGGATATTTATTTAAKDPFANMELETGKGAMTLYNEMLQEQVNASKKANDEIAKDREEKDAEDMKALEKMDAFKLKMTELDVLHEKIAAEKKKVIDRNVMATKLNIIGQGVSGAASLFEQESAAYKAVAVAGIVISTIAASIAALAPPPTGYGPLIGPWMVAGIVAAGAIGAAQVMGVKFADGGIVSGPTNALIGEYVGARSNPEVVAPLDKLKSIIGGQVQQVEIYGYLDGDVIRLANKNSEYKSARRF
jgi:hypothetical protein